jgi:hypothetical protein
MTVYFSGQCRKERILWIYSDLSVVCDERPVRDFCTLCTYDSGWDLMFAGVGDVFGADA